jgi:hypothetical protein
VRRHVPGVRPAEEQRHPERLGLSHRHVRPKVAGTFQHSQRDRIAHRHAQRPHAVGRLGGGPNVLDYPVVIRALDKDAGDVLWYLREVRCSVIEWQLDDLDLVGLYHLTVAGVEAGGDRHFGFAFGLAGGHQGGLGDGGGTVVDGGVGDAQSGKLGDHRLELEDRLEGALADLRLVRGV